ncbi:patatin-like phospholipase family protein [Paenarthrobacter sp. NPDC089322]|uniref:patatin-like phospholipase family protein n=1 Tax=Paenarthrobacter sp. NPDC089322 TaxID=3155065 RepID=UPI003433A57D
MNTTSSSIPYLPATSKAAVESDRQQLQPDAARRMPADGGLALVLGGGGSTGNAWLIGVIAGMLDAGVDATKADLIIGTSAGSTAAAQLTSAAPAELFAAALAPVAGALPQQSRTNGRVLAGSVAASMDRSAAIIAASVDVSDMRRRMGAALMSDGASRSSAWRSTVAARLPSQAWPQQRVLITAVDARTGDPVVFDRHSGIDLVDAVAASCSSGFAYSIGDHRYIDGGYRTNAENADLAAGCVRVLVLSPFGGRTRTPSEWGLHLETQVGELRAQGSRVELIFPDSDAEHLFGANAMDVSLRPAAAQAGYAQGKARAEQLVGFWR